MAGVKGKRKTYDVPTYAEKVREALRKLEQTGTPGQVTGLGSKTDVLLAAKPEIQRMVEEKRFLPRQISEAISNDVFGILPRAISQLIEEKSRVKPESSKKAAQPVRRQTTSSAVKRDSSLNKTGTDGKDRSIAMQPSSLQETPIGPKRGPAKPDRGKLE